MYSTRLQAGEVAGLKEALYPDSPELTKYDLGFQIR
jgi:hypothetical protein